MIQSLLIRRVSEVEASWLEKGLETTRNLAAGVADEAARLQI